MAFERHVLRVALVLALATAGATARADPTAADKETARALMEEARDLRDKKDLKGALDRFQRADAIMQVPTTGYEVARTQVALGLLVEARDTIARVLRTPAPPNEPRPFKVARKNIEALDDTLEGRIPAVTIVVKGTPAGESPVVTIDDVEVPPAAVGVPRRVDPGHHVIAAKTPTAEGSQELDIAERETRDVVVNVVSTGRPPPAVAAAPSAPAANEQPPEEQPQPPPEPPHRSHLLSYLGFGLAGAGVVVGTVTGVMTLSKKSSLQTECNANGHCPPSANGDLDGANTLATVSTVAFIAAGAGAVLGVVGLFVGGSSAKAPEAPAQARVTPWLGLGAAGVRGTF